MTTAPLLCSPFPHPSLTLPHPASPCLTQPSPRHPSAASCPQQPLTLTTYSPRQTSGGGSFFPKSLDNASL
ncbi:hypothetical protein E2C01_077503 [Portunus trituberculatus]|uniref:Uncharacterized protein n=1 Tax=Portunus trituberculatus TaxID=210409 RepID=A0A5B7IPW2_PORTR|nr:hypothetical protein [Portunus trituberculatus]